MKKVSETLRAAVTAAEAKGITRYRICQETGLDHSSLTRFVYEGRDARASTLDALADFFNLELQPKSKAGREGSGPVRQWPRPTANAGAARRRGGGSR
jgi:transcriptional regulator with XRE-family HTH domain